MKSTRCALLILASLLLAAMPAAAATYSVDPVHSSVVFKIRHFGASNFYGDFKTVTGTIQYDAENPGASSVELEVAADSVDTRNEQRDNHVKSPDFLNAAEFPKITFKSTGVEGSGDTLQVTGKLTLHGVTKDVAVTVEKVGEGKHPRSGESLIGFETHLTINRSDYDMGFMVGPLGEEIHLILSVEAGHK